MPLSDDEWTRGKCAFKLLQYMAASLPCVASPVGANAEAVIDGFNGFHATSLEEWERSLERLINSAELRARFGATGHAHVAERYAMRAYQTNYLALLTRLAADVKKSVCFPACIPLHIYQILNYYTSRQELDPGFDVLDNSANERPDWFEYWPIRKFLLNEPLNEEAFYGFLVAEISPSKPI